MTALEYLSILEENDKIPTNQKVRIEMLSAFYHSYSFITYESIMEVNKDFETYYNLDYIRTLLRKYNILGRNIQLELENQTYSSDEEKWLLYLFFKGKTEDV